MKLVTAAEMRQLEQHAVAKGVSMMDLMRNAGRAVAAEIAENQEAVENKRILVLAGPGNNGGDGLVAARHLKEAGALVDVYLLAHRELDDIIYREVITSGLTPIQVHFDIGFERLRDILQSTEIVLDAVFGTGVSRPISGAVAAVLALVSHEKKRRPGILVMALDLPSGVNADTGAADPASLQADSTVTLGYPKGGLFIYPGAEYAGEVIIADIGIPAGVDDEIVTALLTDEFVRSLLPRRPAGAHKGSFGKTLVVAGCAEYSGAAVLTCLGAYRAGAGVVTLGAPRSLNTIYALKLTETTHLLLPESADGCLSVEAAAFITDRLEGYQALALGPGLGQRPETIETVCLVLSNLPPGLKVVLDADALNALSVMPEWWRIYDHVAVLTPHPGEMARLTGLSVEQIQSDRINVSRRYAELWQQIVVLKGAHTVIASPDGSVAVSPFANPGLSTAGTGDVLAGIIAGMLAQGLDEFEAACAGVYVHAMAGELVRAQIGDCGMIASDLLPQIPRAIKSLREQYHAACH